MFKYLADKEETFFSWLIERWAEKDPTTFWSDDRPKPRSRRWESWIVQYWPTKLTFGYWYYLFADLGGGWRNGYNTGDKFPNWINFPEWGEWRYLFRNWKGEWTGFKWAWIKLTDETKGRRLICRIRGHPEGEVFWNPGGDEPDHHCKTCGEIIG